VSGRAFRRLAERRGVALMLVLWVVIVLSAIALGVVASSRAQTNLAGTLRSRAVARYAAESGVVAATMELTEMFRAAETDEERAQVFSRFEERLASLGERQLGSARYQVAVLDLNSRVDLNRSSEVVLLGLFEQFVGVEEAEALVNALYDWTDEDDEPLPGGAEAREYVDAGSPFLPTNRPLLRLDELARIEGIGDSLAAKLAPYVTVWGDGLVNVNTAPVPVLTAVPEIGAVAAEEFVTARERQGVVGSRLALYSRLSELSPDPVSAQLGDIVTMPQRILIISRGWEEGRPLTHEIQAAFDVRVSRLITGPVLRVRYWTERGL
jgi:general secretion pathway protein K